MAADRIPPETRTVVFAGREVHVSKPAAWQTRRLISLIFALRKELGLTDDDLQELNGPQADYFRFAGGIIGKFMTALVAEVNLDDPGPQLPPFARKVYHEVGALIGLTAEEFDEGTLDEQYEIFNVLFAMEADTTLGKHVRPIVGGLTNILTMVKDRILLTLTGGAMLGGMTSSLAPSSTPTTGPKTIS